ncbi:MAG: tetratricopeptide repeat protein [Pseudotabrizicola sp.]|jgi:Flp pilus assembly protein TadD|uniref:tetratricopeptide repeat protein n=1 Tax=Pseudotabrizicola sp. TaxID=2939647 RepID=UPI002726A051|nr:tetratricopeptide repeat protein [Pseudotabrizicola sp.]MDO8884854.1 tetratricopeptide repeat protein [Pseudotabrizicola sp.]MDP2081661.1 tetratricopeptide repeat protein [Pseudotabrizicola sp.]MDZ7574011.1 tetratricopeptide repeat protein [Pseudotabrizicola sp.]
MRRPIVVALCLSGAVTLSACQRSPDAEVQRALKDVNVIDESNLSDIMLTVGDPEEAVSYFQRTAEQNPDRIDLKRGLAKSLVRAGRPTEAAAVWRTVVAHPQVTNDDRVSLADALIRANEWSAAEAELNKVPPTHETFERYRLEAMVADSKKNWKKADSFYEIAAGLTTKPSGVLNNWGFSKLTRGDAPGAEKLFVQALTYDPTMFTTKNNLVLARGAQRKYELPVVKMSQSEKAELLYTMALTAIKQGDVSTGKQLLREAVETHPQHFETAARALAALEA